MYTIIKNVITIGNYELSDILNKIDTLWITGELTNEQHDELIALARENATPEQSYAPLQTQIDVLFAELKALKATVEANAVGAAAMKEAIEKLGGTVENTPVQGPEVPDWHQPINKEDAYMTGDKMKYTDGKIYESTIDYNVWTPEDYPDGWKLVEDTEKTV